ncbi:hypothetical protein [Rhizobium sp. A37_96]
MDISLEEAIASCLSFLKTGKASQHNFDLYPHEAARLIAQTRMPQASGFELDGKAYEIGLIVLDAASELCARGILRPGPKITEHITSPAWGYSLTSNGRKSLPEIDDTDIVLYQPGALAAAFSSYTMTFGEAFSQRSQEAVKCRNANAWLGCCAMAGAAAEAIMLAVAFAKTKDEDKVRKDYNGAGGRQKILNLIIGPLLDWQKTSFKSYTGIIAHWRDEAAHGAPTALSTANADEALRQLLHMCQWVKKYWDDLTT